MTFSTDIKDRYIALLESPEYRKNLDTLTKEIVKESKIAMNEASLSSVFENKLYYYLKAFFGFELRFDKEITKKFFRHDFKGRLDAVSSNILIEYKHYSRFQTKSEIEKAINQTENYIVQLNDKGKKYDGILTDGIKIVYFTIRYDKCEISTIKDLGSDDINRIIVGFLALNRKRIVAANIAQDFAISSTNHISLSLARAIYDSLKDENIVQKTQMLFDEWLDLFHLSESDEGMNRDIDIRRQIMGEIFNDTLDNALHEYRALFALQTTYAIIVKLIACKVIYKITYGEQILYFDNLFNASSEDLRLFLTNMEEGYDFSISGVRNLLEGDFFSWYTNETQWSRAMYLAFKNVIGVLDSYEDVNFNTFYEPEDLFKELYIETIPKVVRHSLGEYFTPRWLAERVVSHSIESIEDSEWTAIDPCCGSGVFLIALIKNILINYNLEEMSQEEKSVLLKSILHRVKGVDLNPLSVLTTRISYFLSVFSLKQNSEHIQIPVYLGDSTNIPQVTVKSGIEVYEYSVKTKKGNLDIILPVSLVNSDEFSDKMYLIQKLININDAELVQKQFEVMISSDDLVESITLDLRDLSEKLVSLNQENWDGIWIRIVTNFLSTAKFDKFDIIVGNPPWVKWEYLPQAYSQKIKDLCVQQHLFSNDKYIGGLSLNVCALLANTTAVNWLKSNGILAFLMPKTMLTQRSYEGFRNFYIDYEKKTRLYLQELDDWSMAGHPFEGVTEKFMSYYYTYAENDYSKGVSINSFEKKRGVDIQSLSHVDRFEKILPSFNLLQAYAYQIDPTTTGFTFAHHENTFSIDEIRSIIGDCVYKARSGAEFTPAEVYFLNYVESERDVSFFKNIKYKSSKYKVGNTKSFPLETEYIYPLVYGPMIRKFKMLNSNAYGVFPYDFGKSSSVTISELMSKSPVLLDYLISQKHLITKQSTRSKSLAKGDDFYALSKIGQYTFEEYKVAFRDNTRMAATVLSEVVTGWGETKPPICVKHAPYISMTKDGRAINREEAYFIAGILNTNIVGEYFSMTYDSRSFSIDLKIKIPEFDEQNPLHLEISRLSILAHTDGSDNIQEIVEILDQLYIELCKSM